MINVNLELVQRSMLEEVPRPRIAIRREKVAEAARMLFARYGFHATGIAQIADVSGIAVQQIYRDFCNKEGIVEVIVTADVGQLFAEVSRINQTVAGQRIDLRGWLQAMLSYVTSKDHSPLFLEIFAEASRNPRIAAILQEIDFQFRTALIEAFAARVGTDADPSHAAALADLFLTFVGGLSERRVAHPDFDAERLADLMCRIIADQVAR